MRKMLAKWNLNSQIVASGSSGVDVDTIMVGAGALRRPDAAARRPYRFFSLPLLMSTSVSTAPSILLSAVR